MGIYEQCLWPVLQRMDPEASHTLALGALSLLQRAPGFCPLVSRLFTVQDERLQFSWRGLTFRNPIGLAAGFDKDARLPRFFQALGFGFLEVGTVTPRPQPGNPRPRLFRVRKKRALLNHLGFPSVGVQRVAASLRAAPARRVPLGINIGVNARTPLDRASGDYLECLEILYPSADYFVVNVSSPNTLGLTRLQAKPALASLTAALWEKRLALAQSHGGVPKPLLMKISPDLSQSELDDVIEVTQEHGVNGIVAVNTSSDPGLKTPMAHLPGGISGEPLGERALEVVEYLRREVPRDFFIIGVGGIFDARDAWALLQAGADAVQVYTGLVYRGPGAVAAINRGLVSLLRKTGVWSIGEARLRPSALRETAW